MRSACFMRRDHVGSAHQGRQDRPDQKRQDLVCRIGTLGQGIGGMVPHPFLKAHPADPERPFGARARILFDELHVAGHLFHEPDGGVV
jgi:hypothetical protein